MVISSTIEKKSWKRLNVKIPFQNRIPFQGKKKEKRKKIAQIGKGD